MVFNLIVKTGLTALVLVAFIPVAIGTGVMILWEIWNTEEFK